MRETFPLAVAFAMSVIYFRVLVVLVSLLSTDEQTGIFGTSFRIFELLLGLPALVLSVALPLLSVAGAEDDERLRKGLQSMTEASFLIAGLLVVGVWILAKPGILLVGGEQYVSAAPVLRIQAVALIPVFLGQVWQLGLIAGRSQRAMAVANGLALVLVIALGLCVRPGRRCQGRGLGGSRSRDSARAVPALRARAHAPRERAEPVVRLETGSGAVPGRRSRVPPPGLAAVAVCLAILVIRRRSRW